MTDLRRQSPEEIIAAAVRLERDNSTYSLLPPARHGEVIRLVNSIYEKDDPNFLVRPDEQGFVTSYGRFVDRETARKIADFAGQTSRRDQHMEHLFSEDLW